MVNKKRLKNFNIKRLDVWSVAKIYSLVSALGGFIAALLLILLSMMFGNLMQMLFPNLIVSWVLLIQLPLIYGIVGIIIGALAAWFYNIIAGWVGGVVIELEEVH